MSEEKTDDLVKRLKADARWLESEGGASNDIRAELMLEAARELRALSRNVPMALIREKHASLEKLCESARSAGKDMDALLFEGGALALASLALESAEASPSPASEWRGIESEEPPLNKAIEDLIAMCGSPEDTQTALYAWLRLGAERLARENGRGVCLDTLHQLRSQMREAEPSPPWRE